MDDAFLKLAIRLSTLRRELGHEAYRAAIHRAELALAHMVLELAERDVGKPHPQRPSGSIIMFPSSARLETRNGDD